MDYIYARFDPEYRRLIQRDLFGELTADEAVKLEEYYLDFAQSVQIVYTLLC